MNYPTRELPQMLLVRQHFSKEHIENVETTAYQKLLAAGLKNKVAKGAKIAITAGSRGLGGFNELVKGVARALRDAGAEPFIIPAMGSHGGATAEGQKAILVGLGIREDEIGAEIRPTMETICLGQCKTGARAHLDKNVADADGVIVLGRVKTHPQNTEGIASGLLKMTTVGLGKQIGAHEAHSHGLWNSVKAVPELTLANGKVLFGIAVVENAYRQPVAIEVVPGNYTAFYETDQKLLNLSKQHFARIPFDNLDVLVVDQLGKNVSGTGMDLNVIGTWRMKGGEKKPDYKRIVVLSLTPESKGNGLGIGLADFTTERFTKEFNPQPTWVNLFTSTEPGGHNTKEGMLPLALKTDREAIGVALYSAMVPSPRICRIRNTADLDQLWISENLMEEARAKNLEVVPSSPEMQFDPSENLVH
jgi:hypothetical protein